MRILFLTQVLPYPPDAGPRVKTWNVIRYLTQQGHEVHLISFLRSSEAIYLDAVRDVCASVQPVRIRRSRSLDLIAWLKSHSSGRPFLVERDDQNVMRQQVLEGVAERDIEAIHADQLSMAQFALQAREEKAESASRLLLIFDAHNAVWKIVERYKQTAPMMLKHLLSLERQRLKRYEGRMMREFDRILAVSKTDRRALIEASIAGANGSTTDAGQKISVVPIAVDTEQLRPVQRQGESPSILTIGTLHYPPNADGIRWFAREIFPLVREQEPNATLTIVGKNPPRDLQILGANDTSAVEVTGYVPDLMPYLKRAAVLVVPVRVGGGIRVRILEGFARGLPMVTTTLGLEGIEAQAGREILLADDADAFAAAVIRLLENPRLGRNLAKNGRRLAEQEYDWRRALSPLREIYAEPMRDPYAVG